MKPFGVFSGVIIVSVRMLLVDTTVFAGWDAVQIEKAPMEHILMAKKLAKLF